METEAILGQIDSLLAEYERAREASPNDDLSGGLSDAELGMIRTRYLAAIDRLAPPGSIYVQRAHEATGWDGFVITEVAGILRALRADAEAGYTQGFAELVHADIFEDFLEMAAELLGKGYEVAAAVLAGSVLEEHVRKLAEKEGIATDGVGFDRLTVELVKAGSFGEPQRKILVGWYGQRTEAAHGRPENLVSDQVAAMPNGIREFLVRYPA